MKSQAVSPCQIWENCRLPLISMGNLVIFVVWLLNNRLVNVAETLTDILKERVPWTTVNKFVNKMKVYVVSKYLNRYNTYWGLYLLCWNPRDVLDIITTWNSKHPGLQDVIISRTFLGFPQKRYNLMSKLL